jgi:hypothetical protein
MALKTLAWRTFAWLPVCFAAWYWLAPWHAQVAGWGAQAILGMIEPDVVEKMERTGAVLSFVTSLEAVPLGAQRSLLVVEVDALLYTFGLPLFVALMLASRAALLQAFIGVVILLPVQGAGITLGFLVQLLGQGQNIASVTGLVGWRIEALVLGYQFATLVMPGAVPILLWCAWRREVIATGLGRARPAMPAPS